MDCWAACLGGCSDKMSGEHLVSKSLFVDQKVTVHGFSWCPEPKQIGIASLTANILCTKHNSDLSPVDDGGAAAFHAMREMMRISNIRKNMRRVTNVVRHEYDGPLLERWLLMTLINICYKGEKPIGEGAEVGKPTEQLVRIAYGLEPFPRGAGLSWIVRVGMQAHSTDTVKFAPIFRHGQYIDGGHFIFRGQALFLNLWPGGPGSLAGLVVGGEDVRARAFVEILFNLGLTRLDGFREALSAAMQDDWRTCASQFTDSRWYSQVGIAIGERGYVLTYMIETGEDVAA
jgi:hypothetical protein